MSYDPMVKTEQALNPLWQKARLKGYCWDLKSESGISLMVCLGEESVFVSKDEKGLITHEFRETTGTKLGRQVRKLLREAGLLPGKSAILSSSSYTWKCSVCGKRGEVDPGLAGEVDSRGAGARELAIRIYEAHEDASPGCPPGNLEVISPQMVTEKDLMRLISLKREQ